MYNTIKKLIITLTLLLLTTSMTWSNQPKVLPTLLTPQDDISKYNTSNVHLHLTPGEYHLANDLVLDKIDNFTISGTTYTKIKCILPVGIIAINARNITMKNIALVNCRKQHLVQVVPSNLRKDVKLANHNASIILHNCTSMTIDNVTITVMPGIAGVLASNIYSLLYASNIKVIVNCSSDSNISSDQVQINGIIFNQRNFVGSVVQCVISNFQYSASAGCLKFKRYALGMLLFKWNHDVSITINNANINSLYNTGVLYYYSITCGIDIYTELHLQNINVSNHMGGNSMLTMFHIILRNHVCIIRYLISNFYNRQHCNIITFVNCKFDKNKDIRAVIFIIPASTRGITGHFDIINSTFCENQNVNFINAWSLGEILWQLTNSISVINTNISSNYHYSTNSLMSVTNGVMFIKSSMITGNQNYGNLIKLYLSLLFIEDSLKVSNNSVRYVLKASKDRSYIFVMTNTTVQIVNNALYSVLQLEYSDGIKPKRVCHLQFYSTTGLLERQLQNIKNIFNITIIDNTYMTAKENLAAEKALIDCQWIARSAFYAASSKIVYHKTMTIRNTVIGKDVLRPVPMSVCPCSDDKINCSWSDLGKLSPGQTLKVKLHVSEHWLDKYKSVTTLVAKNSAADDCVIMDASQLSQTHFNYSCNQYSYTIQPRDDTVRECELYIGLSGMPEMFFVQIKPCPKGFILQEDRRACYCDPTLNSKVLSITTCNLNDETILRPASSWISASTDNDSKHYYHVSPYCPLDYCLPQSSHLNLSNPDSQCQFNRSGMLCGQCQRGLSAVFGSSHCERCSSIYLLIIIPIAIAGIVLVIVLFIFNLTVVNGTINTFIFYVNIININMSLFSPVCYPVLCTLLSLLNLDLGITTCFYNGMDDYAKMWLQIAFPTYLIMIASLLIITSRYFTIVQRMTAHRGLAVLATLFLLSYTKVLSTVCNALFWYSELTLLPNNTSTIIWLTDTSSPVFGIKFSMIFVVYLCVLLLLLPFNLILLCRRLSAIRFINSFKPLLDVYFSPYKDKHYYWMGLQLFLRAVIYGFSALDRDYRIVTISVLLLILLCIQGFVQPFKNKFNNVQELLILFNLLVVHIFSCHESKSFDIISQTLITVAVVYFIIAISFLCSIDKCKTIFYRNKFLCYMIDLVHKIQQYNESEMNTPIRKGVDTTSTYEEFREPLVEFES